MKIFHHNDLDGHASGFVVGLFYNHFKKEDFFEVDYVQKLPLDIINRKEQVWFVDYSFSENTKETLDELMKMDIDLIWIDHHASSLELIEKYPKYSNIKGLRINGISGAALTYMYCYNVAYELVPYYLQMVSDHDCWHYKLSDTTNFVAGMGLYNTLPYEDIWQLIVSDKNKLLEILEKGKIVEQYKTQNDTYYREHFWYETTLSGFKNEKLNGIKAAVINKRSGSKIFAELYDKYPLVIAWVFDGENYIYSFFSNKKNGVNCKEIAQELGGGGHIGAAGCRLNYLKFKKS